MGRLWSHRAVEQLSIYLFILNIPVRSIAGPYRVFEPAPTMAGYRRDATVNSSV